MTPFFDVVVTWQTSHPPKPLDPALMALQQFLIEAPTREAAEHYGSMIIQALETQANADPAL